MDRFQEVANRFELAYNPGDPSNQDWELTVAEPKLIKKLLAGLPELQLELKPTVAEILIASFDEAAQTGELDESDWELFCSILKHESYLYSHVLEYWAGWSFAITPLVCELQVIFDASSSSQNETTPAT